MTATLRAAVPGGWLYATVREHDLGREHMSDVVTHIVALAFVPTPKSSQPGASEA